MDFFSSVHQFCYSQLLSQWILHPLHIPKNSVTSGWGQERTFWRGYLEESPGPSLDECSAYLDEQGDCTSRIDPDISHPLSPAPFLPYFSGVMLPLAESKCLFFQVPPTLAPSPAASELEQMLEFTTPCPQQPHLHQESVLGASGRVGKNVGSVDMSESL